ncbi:MAG: hypothetical protein QXW47_08235 [Candidatus Jordarchaeales archaeon]
MRWHNASDLHSGVYGFSILWSNAPTIPDTTVDVANTSLTSPPLLDGCWYLNIRTCDQAGNWADTAYHIGPFHIDTTPRR